MPTRYVMVGSSVVMEISSDWGLGSGLLLGGRSFLLSLKERQDQNA